MLEEDKLLRFHERLKDFLQKKLNSLLTLVAVLAFLILLGFGFLFYESKKEERAQREFLQLLHQGGDLKGLLTFGEKNLSTQAGKSALLYLWNLALNHGDLNTALKVAEKLEKSLSSSGKVFVQYTKAKVVEERGDLGQAMGLYENLLKRGGPIQELAYLDLIRLKLKRGDQKAASQLAKEYLKNYGNSTFSGYLQSLVP